MRSLRWPWELNLVPLGTIYIHIASRCTRFYQSRTVPWFPVGTLQVLNAFWVLTATAWPCRPKEVACCDQVLLADSHACMECLQCSHLLPICLLMENFCVAMALHTHPDGILPVSALQSWSWPPGPQPQLQQGTYRPLQLYYCHQWMILSTIKSKKLQVADFCTK